MKAVHKIVAGLAVAGLAVSAAFAVRPFPHKVSKVADGGASGIAAAAAGFNYATGFEAPEYATLGYIPHIDGNFPAGCGSTAAPCWGHTTGAGFSLITPTIDNTHPAVGTQHLRLASDPSTRTNQPSFGLGVDARFPRTAHLSVRPIAPNTVSVDVSVDAIFGSDYRIQPQSNSQGFLSTSLLMYNSGALYVLDDACGTAALGFTPTGTFWDTLGGYQNYTVAMNPCTDTETYYYGGVQVFAGCVIAGTNLEQFLVFSDNFPAPAGFVGRLDADNLSMSSLETCPSVCGNGIIEAPNESCEPGNLPNGCNPGHACGAVGSATECQCARICTLAEPCVLQNGTNGPFQGPFDATFGGIFVYDAVSEAVSVELCGSTGIDTFIQYWGSCADPGDPGVSNDDCCDAADPNCGLFGAGSDPTASCYNLVGAPNYESCTCHDNPVAGDNCYLLQTNGGNSNTATFTIEINKKAVCAGGHLGACCDTNGADTGCTDGVLQSACTGADKVWTENGKCATVTCACIPDCAGATCGSDGCGGSCGNCDDNNICNGLETCNANRTCDAGTALVCNDGNACNGVETCDSVTGCVAGSALVCSDGNVCNGVETCVAPNGCVPGTPLSCDDGLFCTGVESCSPTGGCSSAGNPCTDPDTHCTEATDTCDPNSIPTVSEWGLVVLTLMLLIGAKVYFGRRQAIA